MDEISETQGMLGVEHESISITPTTIGNYELLPTELENELKKLFDKEYKDRLSQIKQETERKFNETRAVLKKTERQKAKLELTQDALNIADYYVSTSQIPELLSDIKNKKKELKELSQKYQILSNKKDTTYNYNDYLLVQYYQVGNAQGHEIDTKSQDKPWVKRYAINPVKAFYLKNSLLEEGVLYPTEKLLFTTAIKDLKSVSLKSSKDAYLNNVILVDILARDKESLSPKKAPKTDDAKPDQLEMHTVVLWKKNRKRIYNYRPKQRRI